MQCFHCGREVKETTHRQKDYKVDYYLLHTGKTEWAFFTNTKEDAPNLRYLKLIQPIDTITCVQCYDRAEIRQRLDDDFSGRRSILDGSEGENPTPVINFKGSTIMDNQKNYRITARQSELAVKVLGTSQADLFANSALALFDVMTDVEKIEVKERLPLEVEGIDRDDLMVNWMRELLYLYQGSGYVLKEFHIREAKDTLVKAEVCGEKIDPDRHEIKREITAVAYHQSRMQKTGDQWTAQLIFAL